MNEQTKCKKFSIKQLLSLLLFGSSISANAQNSSLLWQITKNGSRQPSYLFGTIHAYDPDTVKLPAKVFKSIARCSIFAMEVNPEDINYYAFMSRIKLENDAESEEPVTLKTLLGEAAFAKLMSLPVPKRMGEEEAGSLKPIFATSYLYTDESEKAYPTVDNDLYAYAKQKGKHIVGLETMDEQLAAADSIPLTDQAEMLRLSLLSDSSPAESLQRLWQAYKEQDMAELEKAMEESNPSPLFSEHLLERRNKVMAERIAAHLSSGETIFTAVGALHLSDTKTCKGIVSLLKEKGYELTPVKIKL